jgi:hypothetical protein
MNWGLQDILATATALSALAIIVRRVVGTLRPTANPACANCPLVTDTKSR